MTSSTYYDRPEFLESRANDPRISPPKRSLVSPKDVLTRDLSQSTNPRKILAKNFSDGVATDQGVVDVAVTQSMQTDPYKSLLRNPNEKVSSRLNVNDATINQAMRMPTFSSVDDDDEVKADQNNKYSLNRTARETFDRHLNPHQLVTIVENEQYDHSYQQPVDCAPYEYRVHQSNQSDVNAKMLLEQPGAATGAGSYDNVVWPSNVEIETRPDPSREWYSQLKLPVIGPGASTAEHSSLPDPIKHQIRKRPQSKPEKTVYSELPKVEFDTLFPSTDVVEQVLPNLTKAPETYDLIKKTAQMELTAEKSFTNDDRSWKKEKPSQPYDDRSDSASSDNRDEKHRHHHHRHHHRHHSRSHHHHNHRRQHHSTHHHHHRRSYSPDVHHHHHRDYMPAPHPHHYHHQHHHHTHSIPVQRILTPNPPKVITPTPRKINTSVYRDTGVNTGHETKIMRDSGVTADLDDVPNTPDNRLAKIPVIRRTIIVEPYPAQPSSQILVKPRADMIGKIRLGNDLTLDGKNETIVYPSTAFMTKKSKKKKKATTVVNNTIIEDLHLEDIEDDENDRKLTSTKTKKKKETGKKSIKNAFYN